MTGRALRAIRARLVAADGVTMVELLATMAILLVVLGGMTTLFVSASNSQIDQTNRVQAQQEARLALNSLRREIHCANNVEPMDAAGNLGSWPSASIRINLAKYCPTAGGTDTNVTWCTRASSSAGPWTLFRIAPAGPCTGGTPRADSLMTDYTTPATVSGKIFSYVPATPGVRELPTLHVSLPVDVTSTDASQRFRLEDDIVLRNVPRS